MFTPGSVGHLCGVYTEFECLAVKLVGRRARSVFVACIYRPPGPVSSAFTDQLCQLLDQLVLLNTRFVAVGDFNAPGDIAGRINYHVAYVFTQYDLQQHVNVPTHVGGNTLDLVVSQDPEPGGQLISSLAVQSVYTSLTTTWCRAVSAYHRLHL